MKKLILTLVVTTISFIANAQEPEKKKDSPSPPPSRGQERAINESGVSVKSDSKKNTFNAKSSSSTATVSTPPAEEKKREAKKPE